jgi:hypothetical protein
MDKGGNEVRAMAEQSNPMDKFEFLVGAWDMEYTLPLEGSGTATFKRALDDKYVVLDYSASSPTGETGGAHGIFAWDERFSIYRYWWFENSGNFTQADCNFIDDHTLLMHWDDGLLIQTFQKTGPDRVDLAMKSPNAKGEYEPVLKVVFTRKGN